MGSRDLPEPLADAPQELCIVCRRGSASVFLFAWGMVWSAVGSVLLLQRAELRGKFATGMAIFGLLTGLPALLAGMTMAWRRESFRIDRRKEEIRYSRRGPVSNFEQLFSFKSIVEVLVLDTRSLHGSKRGSLIDRYQVIASVGSGKYLFLQYFQDSESQRSMATTLGEQVSRMIGVPLRHHQGRLPT